MAKKKKEKDNGVIDAANLRGKTADEIKAAMLLSKKELFNMRFQKAAGEQIPAHRGRIIKKNIARIKTIQNEQKRGANA